MVCLIWVQGSVQVNSSYRPTKYEKGDILTPMSLYFAGYAQRAENGCRPRHRRGMRSKRSPSKSKVLFPRQSLKPRIYVSMGPSMSFTSQSTEKKRIS